jgi:hypothetical protein
VHTILQVEKGNPKDDFPLPHINNHVNNSRICWMLTSVKELQVRLTSNLKISASFRK